MSHNGRNECTRILSHLLLVCLLIGAVPIVLDVSSENAAAATTYTWSAGADSYAGISTSWTPNGVPGNTDTVIFDATSSYNCNWNITPTLGAFYMLTGYSGTVTQAASFGVSATYTQQAGTFTGSTSYWLNDSGSFIKTGGTLTTGVLNLNMTGASSTLSVDVAVQLYKGVIFGSVTYSGAGQISTSGYGSSNRGFSVFGALSISYGMTWAHILAAAGSGVFLNVGTITGLGTFEIDADTSSLPAQTFGTINCPVLIRNVGGFGSDQVLALAANTVFGSNLTVYSSHATKLMTLSHGSNYQLTVSGAVVLGVRGIMTQGTGTWTFGSYTQNGASTVYSEGGNIVVDTDFSLSAGTFNGGSSSYSISCGRNFTKSGGAFGWATLNLNMTGTGTLSENDASAYYSRTVFYGTTTVTGSSTFQTTYLKVYGTLSISYGSAVLENYNDVYANYGTITGLGTLTIYGRNAATYTFTFGTVNCPVLIDEYVTNAASSTLYLGSNTVLGSNLTVRSDHASYTMTLSHGTNYQLTVAGAVVLGTRGIMTQGTGAWSFGSYTQNGTSSVFTQGGSIACNGGFLTTAGIFTPDGVHWLTVTGDFNTYGPGTTPNKLKVAMTGMGVNYVSNDWGLTLPLALNISGSVTISYMPILMTQTDSSSTVYINGTLINSNGLYVAFADGFTLTPTGVISGTDFLSFQPKSGTTSMPILQGTITCILEFYPDNLQTSDMIVNLSNDLSVRAPGSIQIGSDSSATCAFDLNGHSLTFDTLLIYPGGIISGNSSTIHCYGNWNFGEGAFIPGTSTVIMYGNSKTIKTANTNGTFYDLQINGTVSILSNLNVSHSLVNNGAITQNGKRLNISGSSATPLTGYGTFDGDLYLNGSAALMYEIQTGLPMGNLHTDRDTKISISPTQYLRVTPTTTDFVNVSIESYGAQAGYVRWVADSTGPVIYTIKLVSNQLYEVSVDNGTKVGAYQADQDGAVQFTYNGPFSSHSFIVQDIRSLPCKLWASFTYSIEDLKVEFIDTTYAQPTLRIWSFGDGWGSTNPYPTHTYENSGTYRVTMRAYDEYGHSSMVEMMITVSLGPTTPLEHTGTGWNIYLGNNTTISVSAVGLLISGAISLVSTWYIPSVPFITTKARRLYGILAILAAVYFLLFVKGMNIGGFG